jgi:quercetin 2,3-dioxygenase
MAEVRKVIRAEKSKLTMEGAGVRLKRAFGGAYTELDPFLLLDDFHSDNPDDYMSGFPWHPHRGIETITYMLKGRMEHGDSLGNQGAIGAGDVQWMTAGGGIVHQEMPKQESRGLWGFQLWANLPAANKMMKPRYQEVQAGDIPEAKLENGGSAKVIAGEIGGVRGPVKDIVTEPEYFDITLPPGADFSHPVAKGRNVFAYVIQGQGRFGLSPGQTIGTEELVVFGQGDLVRVVGSDEGVRFLLVSGRPIKEPVAWRGPIVMNTEQELNQAFIEYEEGTFIKNAQ